MKVKNLVLTLALAGVPLAAAQGPGGEELPRSHWFERLDGYNFCYVEAFHATRRPHHVGSYVDVFCGGELLVDGEDLPADDLVPRWTEIMDKIAEVSGMDFGGCQSDRVDEGRMRHCYFTKP